MGILNEICSERDYQNRVDKARYTLHIDKAEEKGFTIQDERRSKVKRYRVYAVIIEQDKTIILYTKILDIKQITSRHDQYFSSRVQWEINHNKFYESNLMIVTSVVIE